MLPPAVEAPPATGQTALVELGVDLAETCRPATSLPSLEPLVAQHGSNQLVTQARRLQLTLSRNLSAGIPAVHV